MKSSSPCKGSKRRARGRAQRHPGNNTIAHIRPGRAKALFIKYLLFMLCICFNAFALVGRVDCQCLIPAAPLRSALGYVLVAPAGRVHPWCILHMPER